MKEINGFSRIIPKDKLPDGVGQTESGHLYPIGGQHQCSFPYCPARTPNIALVEADEEPRVPLNKIKCLQTCGTAHRGHDPLCPAEAAERAYEEGGQAERTRKLKILQKWDRILVPTSDVGKMVKLLIKEFEEGD